MRKIPCVAELQGLAARCPDIETVVDAGGCSRERGHEGHPFQHAQHELTDASGKPGLDSLCCTLFFDLRIARPDTASAVDEWTDNRYD